MWNVLARLREAQTRAHLAFSQNQGQSAVADYKQCVLRIEANKNEHALNVKILKRNY